MGIPSLNWALFLGLFIITLEWVRRIFWMRRFQSQNPVILPQSMPPNASQKKVSVIIPARNEEKNIAHCLFHLAKQNYSNYEIVVVDDRSSDRTSHLVENLIKILPIPVKLVRVEKLPPGWTGKNHAMMVGSRAASGDWFLFTDADTTHTPASVNSAVRVAEEKKIDFLTLAPQVECVTFWENVVQPLAVSSLALWFNTPDLNKPGSKTVLANGQFILIKKNVYESVGGNESVKSEVVEDVELAKKVKAAGYNIQFLNGTQLYSTRMYTNLSQIHTGWTRIFIHLFGKKLSPLFHKIFLFIFFSIAPFLLCAYEIFLWFQGSADFVSALLAMSLVTSLFIVAVRFSGNMRLRSNPWYALWHPVGSVLMVWILGTCIVRVVFNRPSSWRGDLHR